MEPVTIAIAVAGGAVLYRLMNRGNVHAEWKLALEEAAARLGGRASPGTRFDTPSLRATVDQIPVTITIQAAHRASEKGIAIADAGVGEPGRKVRLYFGWDVGPVRRELEYIPEIPFPAAFGLAGRVTVRADDAALASHFVEHAANDLNDVRREAEAHGLEILVRGGTLRMAVHGIQRSSWMIERIVTATTRLVRGIDFFTGSSSIDDAPTAPTARAATPPRPEPPPEPEVFEEATCNLCSGERKRGQPWVRCNRCRAAYHQHCWVQATGCLGDGCAETRATPI